MKTYQQISTELVGLLEEKRKAYGDGFDGVPEILKILYPEGVQPEHYQDLLTLTRILDKIYRISNNDTTEDPWFDIAGYCFLTMRKRTET
jgi:hypothetical protein